MSDDGLDDRGNTVRKEGPRPPVKKTPPTDRTAEERRPVKKHPFSDFLARLRSSDHDFDDRVRKLLNDDAADASKSFDVRWKSEGPRFIAELTLRKAGDDAAIPESDVDLHEAELPAEPPPSAPLHAPDGPAEPPSPVASTPPKASIIPLVLTVALAAVAIVVANAAIVSRWMPAASSTSGTDTVASAVDGEGPAESGTEAQGGEKSASAGDPKLTAVTLPKASRSELVAEVGAEVRKALKEQPVPKAGTDAATAGRPWTQEELDALAKNVAARVEFPETLASDIAGKVKIPEASKEKDGPRASEAKPAAAPAKVPTAKEIADQLKASLSKELGDFNTRAGSIEAALKSSGGAAAARRTGDIWIVGLHARAIDQSQFKPAIGDVLRSYPRGPTAPVRLGYMFAETTQITPVVRPDAVQADLASVVKASPDTQEFPEGFGVDLDRQFDRKQPRQCAVLIASPSCPVLRPDHPGWEVIPEVHVVLVAEADLDGEQKSRLADWHRFVQSRKGTLRIVFPEASLSRQNEILKRELQKVCDQALQSQ